MKREMERETEREPTEHSDAPSPDHMCVRESERGCMCVCVCDKEMERERKNERERERWREIEKERELSEYLNPHSLRYVRV